MLGESAVFNKPTNILTSFHELKPRKSIKFSPAKLVFSGNFVCWKSVSFDIRAWSSSTMSESGEPHVLRDKTGDDEGVRAFEQEAFIDGSSDCRPNFIGDRLQSILNSLSKWLVVSLFGIVLLWRHDAEALWAAMGSVLNAGLSNVLKQILNQERPVSTMRSDPGMPSSHAQSIFYFVTFAILSIMEWLGMNVLSTTLSGFVLVLGSYFSWLRIYQQLHTISQVIVGAVLGSVFAFLWIWSWDAIVLKAFISYLWVRIVVILGAAAFCLGFLAHVIRYWIRDEQ